MPGINQQWEVDVFVTLKPSVLDPQGATVKQALNSMKYTDLTSARLGKYFQLKFDGKISRESLNKQVKQICDKFLANPVIERYTFEIKKKKNINRKKTKKERSN